MAKGRLAVFLLAGVNAQNPERTPERALPRFAHHVAATLR